MPRLPNFTNMVAFFEKIAKLRARPMKPMNVGAMMIMLVIIVLLVVYLRPHL